MLGIHHTTQHLVVRKGMVVCVIILKMQKPGRVNNWFQSVRRSGALFSFVSIYPSTHWSTFLIHLLYLSLHSLIHLSSHSLIHFPSSTCSIYPSIHWSIYPSIHWSTFLHPAVQFIHPFIDLHFFIHLFILSIHSLIQVSIGSIYPSIYWSAFPHPSICLLIHQASHPSGHPPLISSVWPNDWPTGHCTPVTSKSIMNFKCFVQMTTTVLI